MNHVSIPFSTIKSKDAKEAYAKINEVSIPFSTIKSKSGHLSVHTSDDVSIPFSTIKSSNGDFNTRGIMSFQFHLVRLKVKVSPSVLDNLLFQFHLVRLKVYFFGV